MDKSIWSNYMWPLITSITVGIFALLVLKQYFERRKLHQLYWSIGLIFYAIAALFEAYSEFTGNWSPFVYRIYVVLAASLVGFLGLGTLELISRRKIWPNLYLIFNIICLFVFFYGSFTAKLNLAALKPGVTVGGKALGPSLSFPRVMSLFFNIPGTLFLFGGAVLSVFRFLRKREFAYRVWANIFIAAGTAVIAWAGAKARLGSTQFLYPAEMIGSALLFYGFILAGTLEKGAQKIRQSLEFNGKKDS
ncbi:MAG: hypothetical protein N2440_05620 [Actinobacteria bacterium]|nr:hypothetical protein [Actinomycetota bacterium]